MWLLGQISPAPLFTRKEYAGGSPLLTPVKGTPPDARPAGGLGAGSDPSAVKGGTYCDDHRPLPRWFLSECGDAD